MLEKVLPLIAKVIIHVLAFYIHTTHCDVTKRLKDQIQKHSRKKRNIHTHTTVIMTYTAASHQWANLPVLTT